MVAAAIIVSGAFGKLVVVLVHPRCRVQTYASEVSAPIVCCMSWVPEGLAHQVSVSVLAKLGVWECVCV